MLILIDANNGEKWEDYHHWIERVYDIPDETGEALYTKFKEFIVDKMLEHNITVNPHYPTFIMNHSKIKNKKLHKSILKKHGNIFNWIEATYGVEPIKFDCVLSTEY